MEVQIPEKVFKKVMHWVNKSQMEVSGFGKVVANKTTGAFEVTEVFLLEQEGGAAHTDICPKALGKLLYQSKDTEGDLRWWWHSHVKMDVFWSGTDTDTIKELGRQGWIVASVFNQREEVRSALCYQVQSQFGDDLMLQDNVTTNIMLDIDPQEIANWDAEYTAKVKAKPYVSSTWPKLDVYSREDWDYKPDRGATILDATTPKSETHRHPVSETYQQALLNEGILGWGTKLEADALGYTEYAYKTLIEYADWEELCDLEERLDALQRAGKINFPMEEFAT